MKLLSDEILNNSSFLKEEIFNNLESVLGKEILDIYFLSLDGFKSDEIVKILKIDKAKLNDKIELAEKYIIKFLKQNGYSNY
jgi:hypothetical protein